MPTIIIQGNLAFKKKDFKVAIESYSEAIRCDEDNATYYSNRAAAYLALYKYLLNSVCMACSLACDGFCVLFSYVVLSFQLPSSRGRLL